MKIYVLPKVAEYVTIEQQKEDDRYADSDSGTSRQRQNHVDFR